MKQINGQIMADILAIIQRGRVVQYTKDSLKVSGDRVPPTLAIVCFGKEPASLRYVEKKVKTGTLWGMCILPYYFTEKDPIEQVIDFIQHLNALDKVHGIIVQHPIPSWCRHREQELFDCITPGKDVDGLTSVNQGRLMTGQKGFQSSTAKGIVRLLDLLLPIEGQKVTIIGASNLVGKPLSVLLINAGATVTILQKSSRYSDLLELCQTADILIGACGVPNLVRAEFIKQGAVLIDAGFTLINDAILGDIHRECYVKSRLYTSPVNGVGPMTVATLLMQTIDAAVEQFNA